MSLNREDSRLTSSLVLEAGSRRLRSRVRPISSAVSAIRSTGRSARPATSQLASSAITMLRMAAPIRTSRSPASWLATGPSGWPTTM